MTWDVEDAVPARTALVDDHPVFRMGLRAALDRDPRLRVVIESGSPRHTLELARSQPLELAIIDLVLPEMPGIELVRELRRLQPHVCVLGLSMLEDPIRIAELLRAGAAGFVHKTQTPEAILEGVHTALGGVRYLPPQISPQEVDRLIASAPSPPLERLTQREREVFSLMVRGCSNDDIAAKLFIARRTVETHRHHLMHKLSARSVVDLVRIALAHGIAVA